MTLLSFHNRPEVKEFYSKRMAAHIAADDLKQSYGYWEDGKGCSVGCAIHSSDHSAYEREDGPGLPEWLARLQDVLFEGLETKEARQFSAQFFPAIPVGVNLESVKWKFCAFLMRENIERVSSLDIDKSTKRSVVDALHRVLALHERAAETGVWDALAAESVWSAAESAWSAAWSAARSARSAARSARSAAESARSAAWSAAESAESVWSAAESAAESVWSAARSAAWRAAWSAAYKRYADHLLSLLKEAK